MIGSTYTRTQLLAKQFSFSTSILRTKVHKYIWNTKYGVLLYSTFKGLAGLGCAVTTNR